MQNKSDNNKSLILYTALIFVAAIAIILIAFLGQANSMKSQGTLIAEKADPMNDGIAQKSAIISEQNESLLKENEALKALNEEFSSDKETLSTRIDELTINYTNGNTFCTVYQYIYEGNMDDAREVMSMVNPDSLTDAQKLIYNDLKKILN